MARVTVEDCIDKVDNRFDLVLLAAHRARMISSGSQLTVDRDNDKNPVVSLREIADSSIRPLIDWLDYNGYTVVTKATKEFIDASGRRKVKGNMDIELAVDAMELAEHVDQIVLFSGDGDFRSLVEAVQRRGVRVTVVSTISSQPPMIADELRRQADVFTDLVELQSKLGRDPSERPAPREPRHHAPQFLQRATTMAPRGADDDFDE